MSLVMEVEVVYTVQDGVIFNTGVLCVAGPSRKEQGAGRPKKEL